MKRRSYLQILGAGVGGTALTKTSELDALRDGQMQAEEPVSLEDVMIPREVFNLNLEADEFHSGPTAHIKHDVRRDDEVVSLHAFERTLGCAEAQFSPVEITTRLLQLPSEGSKSYDEELKEVFDWVVLSRSHGTKLSSERLSELFEASARKVIDGAETDSDVHLNRGTVDGFRQFEQWTRKPMVEPRDDAETAEFPPTDAFWENASIVEMTEWGAFEVSIAVEQPSEEYQSLRAVREVAELQRRRVQSSKKPHPQLMS